MDEAIRCWCCSSPWMLNYLFLFVSLRPCHSGGRPKPSTTDCEFITVSSKRGALNSYHWYRADTHSELRPKRVPRKASGSPKENTTPVAFQLLGSVDPPGGPAMLTCWVQKCITKVRGGASQGIVLRFNSVRFVRACGQARMSRVQPSNVSQP